MSEIEYPKYWNPKNGQFWTQTLFREFSPNKRDKAPYCLGLFHKPNQPSLYLLYLEMEDITEHKFAETYLGGWAHWKQLEKVGWFQPYLTKWREELKAKMKSKALDVIKEVAKDKDSKEGIAANKFIIAVLDKEEVKEGKRAKGRPSKAAVAQQITNEINNLKDVEDDLQRILLSTNAQGVFN